VQVHTDSSGDASGRRGGYGVTRLEGGGNGGRIGGESFKGRALLRREMEDVAAVFLRQQEDARRDGDCKVIRSCRRDTVILRRTYF